VTSAHLDNRSRLGRIFASLGTARVRQARGLIRSLALEPPRAVEVVGGDFNTWRGRTEEVVGIMRQAFPESPKPVHGATHAAGMHLDYLFARGPANAVSGQRKVPGRFGSDHGPILAWARLPGPGACPAAPSA
jgi:endonuclease/exonuclease/phosphatase family metal-dependent hydrolase